MTLFEIVLLVIETAAISPGERGLAGGERVVAGVADPAAELVGREADVAADQALVNGQ